MNDHLYFAASLHRLYNLTLRDFGRANGLSQTEMDVLLFLHNNPDCNTARDMVHLRGLAKSNVSTALDSLRTRGLVESRPEENNRRVNRLFLLPAAAPLIEGLSQRQGQFFRALQRGLTPEQQAQANAYFAVLQRNINVELARLGEGSPAAKPEPENRKDV